MTIFYLNILFPRYMLGIFLTDMISENLNHQLKWISLDLVLVTIIIKIYVSEILKQVFLTLRILGYLVHRSPGAFFCCKF